MARKFGRRRRPRKGGKSLKKTIAKVATRVVRRNIETQHSLLAVPPAAGAVAAQPGVTFRDLTALCCTVAPTAYSKGRTGVRCRTIGIRIKYQFAGNFTTNPIQNVRIMVFRWKPPSNTEAPIEGTLLMAPNGIVALNGCLSPLAWNLRHNFTMLYDKTHTLGSVSVQSGPSTHTGMIALGGKKVFAECSFNDPATNEGPNHIYMAYCSDVSANFPTFYYNVEYLWEDA